MKTSVSVCPGAPRLRAAGRRRGGILMVVMVIVIAVCWLGAALLSLGQFDGTTVVRQQQSQQAFWAAEGGLYNTIAQLRADGGVLDSPPVYSNALAAGAYTLVTATNGPYYTLTSRARVGQAYRTVTQTLYVLTNTWPNSGAVLISGGNLTLAGVSSINGDILSYGNVGLTNTAVSGDIMANGNVKINVGTVSNGTVRVTAGHSVIPGSLPQSAPPDPLPEPTDWTAARVTYSNMIAYAASKGVTPPDLTKVSLSLGGGTNYYKGSISQKNGGPSIFGPGAIVTSGDMSVLFSIVGSVTFIAGGKIQLGTGSAPANFPITNCTFFSGSTKNRMWLDCPNLHFHNCILMSCQNLDARQFDMTDDNSVLLALGSMTFGDNTATRIFHIQGRVEAGTTITADSKTSFTIGVSTNLPSLPPGFVGDVQITSTQWVDLGSAPWTP